jgi:hypothetical protein
MTLADLLKELNAKHFDPQLILQHEGEPVDVKLVVDPVAQTINLTISKSF